MRSEVSPFHNRVFPPLDLHAHIDVTVTDKQLATLGTAIVFAVTRSLAEASQVNDRADPNLVWGVGVHPGLPNALAEYDATTFRTLLSDFVFVGEIGLDRRGGNRQVEVLLDMLAAARSAKRICSIHSTGRQGPVLEALGSSAAGMILHWFTGTATQIQRLSENGAFFSVNVAMTDAQLEALPPERLLPETDFPFSRKAGSSRPGDIEVLEGRVSDLLGMGRDAVRQMWYRNLRSAFTAAGCLNEAPAVLTTAMLSA